MQLHHPLNPSTGVEDPTLLPWTNGVPSTGTEGSYPPYQLVVNPQTELINLITLAGMTPADSDLDQVTRAIRSGQLDFGAVDSGSADALVAKIKLPHTAILAGLPFAIIKSAVPNATTTPTLTIEDTSGNNGLTATIVKSNGSPVASGDLPANALLVMRAISANNLALVSSILLSDVNAMIAAQAKPGLKAAFVLGTNGVGGNTITGSITVPAGCTFMDFDLVSGGGGSGGASQAGGSTCGAGSGMHVKGEGIACTPLASLPYVLGGGGLGGNNAGGTGGAGGYSSFMGATAFGGGASAGNTSASPSTIGAGVGGVGNPFSGGVLTASNSSFESGSSGGTPIGSTQGGTGSSCPFGGGSAPPGSQGSTPGGGAAGVAGTSGGKAGAAGGDGRLIVRFY